MGCESCQEERRIVRLEHSLNGNGRAGLLDRMTTVETKQAAIEATLTRMHGNTRWLIGLTLTSTLTLLGIGVTVLLYIL